MSTIDESWLLEARFENMLIEGNLSMFVHTGDRRLRNWSQVVETFVHWKAERYIIHWQMHASNVSVRVEDRPMALERGFDFAKSEEWSPYWHTEHSPKTATAPGRGELLLIIVT